MLGLYVAVQSTYFGRGFIPGDAFTYLAAGERLNAGHLLYALSPGDRPVDLNPPYWTVPLLSPPPIAVVFRAFATMPPDTGAYFWWALQLVALAVISLVMLARRRPLLTAGVMLLLLIPTVYEIGVGNLNSMVLLGLIFTWRWATRGPATGRRRRRRPPHRRQAHAGRARLVADRDEEVARRRGRRRDRRHRTRDQRARRRPRHAPLQVPAHPP